MARCPGKGKQYTAEYNALTEMIEDLCNALPIDDLLPKMIAKRVITFQDKAEIRAERTNRDKVELFISKLTGEMDCGVNERFYKFIDVMKESPKCDFLVKRMEKWISHYTAAVRSSHVGGTSPPMSAGKNTIAFLVSIFNHIVTNFKKLHGQTCYSYVLISWFSQAYAFLPVFSSK